MNFRRNAAWNVAEVVASGVVLFFLYRVILSTLGVDALGVWSLVLATTSLARVADIGAAGGLGRYVALASAKPGSRHHALAYVETALLANVCLYCLLGFALYAPAHFGVGLVTTGHATVEARELLPFATASFVMANASTVTSAALMGLHRSDQKSRLDLMALALQLVFTIVGASAFGLKGVAASQILQNTFLCITGWALVVREISGRYKFILPRRIHLGALRELFGFGARLQGLNLVTFFFEPAVKYVVSAWGGVGALGLFEMAHRFIFQARQLIVSPMMNLTPMFAAASIRDADSLATIYKRASPFTALAAAAFLVGLPASAPIVSYLWLGHVSWQFVALVAILCAGWSINILAVPAYLMGMGQAQLQWNIAGAALTSCLGPLLGWGFGAKWGTLGVSAGAAIAIGAGAVLTMFMNCNRAKIAALPRANIGSPIKTLLGATRPQ